MCKLRDLIIFLAGAQFFHTISHILLPFLITLPLDMRVITITSTVNLWIIIINALITILLLWWACKLGKKV
jgi:hypothetical protein